MAAARDLNLVERIEDEYTSSYTGESTEVEGFLSQFETLTEGKRNRILAVLQEENIGSVADLQTYIEKVGPDIVSRPQPAREERKTVIGEITAKNVGQLMAQLPQNHRVIKMLNELTPTKQVRALKKAGVKLGRQMDLNNQVLMSRLSDAVATAITGISEGKGRKKFEINTPTGSGRHQ